MRLKRMVIIIFAAVQMLPVFPVQAQADTIGSQSLVINEIQTSGPQDDADEFIELYNLSAENVDITGWRLQYLAAGRDDVNDVSSEASAGREIILAGTVSSGDYLVFSSWDDPASELYLGGATGNWLAKSGGHIRLIDNEGNIIDVVGWGVAAQPETSPVAAALSGTVTARLAECITELPIDSDNNKLDFASDQTPSPGEPNHVYAADCTDDEAEEPVDEEIPEASCYEAVINEILPNSAGLDTGHEYIEIYNPASSDINLFGCSLMTSANSKVFSFAAETWLPAGSYRAFYDTETGLTLNNAAGGQVWLISATTEEGIEYPAALSDDQAWALISSTWRSSDLPTPNQPNQLPPSALDTSPDDEIIEPALEACPEGKLRNPETNRCRSIELVSTALTACGPGQQRNPATNRCRNVAGAVSSLTPCLPGQERNPLTNRCRDIANSGNNLAACQEGYERNPETNRCRKTGFVAGASTGPIDQDQESGGSLNLIIISLVSTLVLGYAGYEYRQDIRNFYARIRARLQRAKLER